jgi:hypothetical protein
MPTVIDALVLELGLDASKFTPEANKLVDQAKKLEDAAQKSGANVESQSKKIYDLLLNVKRMALSTLGLVLGGRGAVEFVDYITSANAATGRLAHTMDVSAGTLRDWQGAFRQIGGTAEGANAALQGLSGEMANFRLTGQSAMLPVLSRLGIGLYDQNRNLKTSAQLWLELSDAVSGMDPREATAFLQMIPGANQDMINFALTGRRTMEQFLRDARAARDLTGEDVRAAQEYQRTLGRLKDSADSLGQSLVKMLGPPASAVMGAIGRVLAGEAKLQYGDTERLLGAERFNEGHEGLRYNRATGRFELKNPPGPHLDMLGNSEETDDQYRARVEEARRAAIKGMLDVFRQPSSGGGSANWQNFLSGLSFLETSQTGAPSSSSSARGYFQFLEGTAGKATAAGLPDPRAGSYSDQAGATAQYIKRFYPEAARAIEGGDYATAITLLRGEWPSLPGGGQPQSAARYATFAAELQGGGPRPPGGGRGDVTYNIGGITVNTTRTDGEGVAREIDSALRRSVTAGAANGGPQ